MSAADTASRAPAAETSRRPWPRRQAPAAGARPVARGGGQPGELALWAVVTAALAGVTALLAAGGVRYSPRDTGGPDTAGGALPLAWPPQLTPVTVVAPVLAAGALMTIKLLARRRAGRPAPSFPLLLGLAYVGTVLWWLALGAASRPGEGVDAALLAAGDSRLSVLLEANDGRPPGPELLIWALARLGLHGRLAAGMMVTGLGALAVPLVAVAVRSLCHAPAARRLLPALVFAPWAPFAAASGGAVTAAVAAGAVAVGTVGSERGRRAWWALGAGLLLGVSGLFGYPAIWLGVAVAAAYFVRRRPLLNVVTGAGALVPLFALRLAGYSWPEDLARASAGLLGSHTALSWLAPDLLATSLCCGPVLARAARRVAMTPGWPFLVGAGAAALFAVVDGLAVGGAQTSWLLLFPWLLVPALAPRPRPALPGDTSSAGEVPYVLVGAGAALAVVLAALHTG
jgi:hypothetical protein